MLYISRVHYEDSFYAYPAITKVKATNSLVSNLEYEYSKQDIINRIQNNFESVKTKYLKNGVWQVGEDVRVVNGTYLRTDSNGKPEDNLGNLPRF